ncbi:hypothetical protein CANMA_002781 [Candida margitis]|uniref:uncharacterized protein n=1 Tax=Candida margitis TaxID=1775924 RepID=UPI0022275FA5|nr:uncharacterized protein CANMA_002781 [Candida margitis]KAI5968013.1 hypothetical protein CANMA_002781 [Candida margitis]
MNSKLERATIAQKIQVLDHFHSSGNSQMKTVHKFKHEMSISKSSLSEWLKREDDIRQRFAQEEFKMSKNSRRKVKFKYEKINKAMDKLVQTRLDKNEPITEPILREYWSVYAHQYGVDDPKRLVSFSHGWLSQFKKRHGLQRSSVSKRSSPRRQNGNRHGENDVEMKTGSESDADNGYGTGGDKTNNLSQVQSLQDKDLDPQLQEAGSPNSPTHRNKRERSKIMKQTHENIDRDTANVLASISNDSSSTSEDADLRLDSAKDTKVTQIPPLSHLPLHDNIRRLFVHHPSNKQSVESINLQKDSDTEAIRRLNQHHILKPVSNKEQDSPQPHHKSLSQSTKDVAAALETNTIELSNPVDKKATQQPIATIQSQESVSELEPEAETEPSPTESKGLGNNKEQAIDMERFIRDTAARFFQTNAQQYPKTYKLFQQFKKEFLDELAITRKEKKIQG